MKKSIVSLALFSSFIFSNYIPESNQPLYQLQTNANNFQGELAYEVADDGVSPAIDLSFNFTFYDQTFSQARMATNGCLHFKTSGAYCNDYTPDPLTGQHTYTMYPFWTDLIRDTNARMKSWGDSSKMIFGWYELREYNRSGSDNSFEIILWPNNTFEYRYGDLDIQTHDVLIGETGNNTEKYTYLFYDECNTGSTNSGTCVNVDWNNSIANSGLESGGSLYGVGSGNGSSIDCSNPLNDMSCAGYWEAFDDQQCDIDPQYAPFCAGYRFEQDVGYFAQEEEFDYGFIDEQDMMASGQFDHSEEHQQEQYEDPFVFTAIAVNEGFTVFEPEPMFSPEPFRQETVFELDPLPELYPELPEELVQFIQFEETVRLISLIEELPFDEPQQEEREVEEEVLTFETLEELEIFAEDLDQIIVEERREEIRQEERVEAEEERLVEAEERLENIFEEETAPVEVEVIAAVAKIDEKSGITNTQLNVVAASINAATSSVSGTTAGNDTHASGNSYSSGGLSSSTSIQTNLTLNFNLNTTSSDTAINTNIGATETTAETTVVTNQVASSGDNQDTTGLTTETKSEADTIADEIVAQNLEDQAKDQIEERKNNSNEYGDEQKIIAYIGFVPGFDAYTNANLPVKLDWYATKLIYTDNTISDNTLAFKKLSGINYQKLDKIIQLQPGL